MGHQPLRGVPRGLSHDEVLARRAQGLGNSAPPATTRTYLQIVRLNALIFINVVLYGTSVALIAMGLWGDALVTAGLVVLNVAIAVAQEARAKRTLDRFTLLTRPYVAVIRDGQEERVDPADLVIGDLVAIRPGDQLVTDGAVVGNGRIDLDDSLLTGESEAVTKHSGDPVSSGSFCVAGSGLYVTKAVGAESLANRLAAGARAFRQEQTPLQRDVNLIIRIMVLVVVMVGGPVVIDLAVRVIDVLTR
jgi:cation-transporting ATPase E